MCLAHGVELCDLGEFGTNDSMIRLYWHGTEVGALDTHFLHEGVPMPTREAVWDAAWSASQLPAPGNGRGVGPRLLDTTCALLSHPNIASKEWIIRQYDHEVQGGSVIKPLVGVGNGGPSDAAVVHPVPGSRRALAISNGLATGWSADPYAMTLAALDECVRN
ncbi:phosphoribosylformylglycinamidine synthase, partial [bacterium]|nr:phosphoribosylformylglycinamidine synthase [bacterium]